MAVVDLTVNTAARAGREPVAQVGVAAAATDQYFFINSGEVTLRLSDGAALATMTVISTQTVDGLDVADRPIMIPVAAGAETGIRLAGPFQPGVYNNADRKVQVTFAAADATLRVEALAPAN